MKTKITIALLIFLIDIGTLQATGLQPHGQDCSPCKTILGNSSMAGNYYFYVKDSQCKNECAYKREKDDECCFCFEEGDYPVTQCQDGKTPPTEGPTHPPTEIPTEGPTQPPIGGPADLPTERPTKTPTEEPTEPPTEEPTEPPTAKPTEPPTEEATEPPTEKPTEPPTEEPTEPPTEEATEPPTEGPTEPPTEEPTEPPTEEPTEPPTEEPTEPPTEEATEPPTEAGTTTGFDYNSLCCPIRVNYGYPTCLQFCDLDTKIAAAEDEKSKMEQILVNEFASMNITMKIITMEAHQAVLNKVDSLKKQLETLTNVVNGNGIIPNGRIRRSGEVSNEDKCDSISFSNLKSCVEEKETGCPCKTFGEKIKQEIQEFCQFETKEHKATIDELMDGIIAC